MEGYTNEIEGRAGILLEACLTEDGRGVFIRLGAYPNQGEPGYHHVLASQLDNSPLRSEEKEKFYRVLTSRGAARIFLPKHTSRISVWN
jgi:hypothetical protein